MRTFSLLPAFLLSLVLLAGTWSCGGSGTTEGLNLGAACTGGGSMCIVSCTLGCTSSSGCTVSEIAVNQPLRFQFSRPVDPSTVNSETFSIKTPGGGQPSGSYVVQGNEVAFIPSVRSEGNRTLFGFAANVIYDVVVGGTAGGSKDVVRSVDGGSLGNAFHCQVVANKGVIDLDGQRPTAQLLVPTTLTDVARNTLIVLEFSEVLNTQIFQNGGAGAGILFTVSLLDESFECETRVKNLPGTVSVNVDERTNKTTVVFRPAILLPQNSCVQVQVTEQIRDLSGKGAVPISWEFRTKQQAIENKYEEEDFDDSTKFDTTWSGALWDVAQRRLIPGKLGGSGKHGNFVAADGIQRGKDLQGRDIYEWNASGQVIPGIRTLSGEDETVGDGVFEFMTFTIKANERVRWVGSRIPLIRVSGRAQIDGAMDMIVPDTPRQLPNNTGQAGGPGVCGGASGGQGGDSIGTSPNTRHGRNGGDVNLPQGHPRAAQAAGTGGGGARANPETGGASSILWILIANSPTFCRQCSSGGAGGSFYSPGGGSFLGTKGYTQLTRNPPQYPSKPGEFGTESTPGKAFAILPEIPNRSSVETFAIGGSGGGGGGCDPFYSFTGSPVWSPGAGGAGGGGCLILQSGGDLVVSQNAELVANGGNAVKWGSSLSTIWPAPGGGGSGGCFLFQTARTPTILGKVEVRGGTGGSYSEIAFLEMASFGGNGGSGYIRVEADPAPSFGSFNKFEPAAATSNNVGTLREVDYNDETIAVSKWYQTETLFSPNFRYYVIEAMVDGKPVTFSDSDTVSTRRAARGANEPITFAIQSAPVSQNGVPLDDPTPWVEDDTIKGKINRLNDYENEVGNGFRWIIRFSRSLGADKVEVKNVKVFYRG